MTTPPSRYRADGPSDYSHRFHAGNVGDVWKHCALVCLLDAVALGGEPVTYLESHAGEGCYDLGATGEWTEGVGRLAAATELAAGDDTLARYVRLYRETGGFGSRSPTRYPGSPVFARASLGPRARLVLFERDAGAFARLAAETAGDSRVRAVEADGLAALESEAASAERSGATVVALVDPPWSQKADWQSIPDLVARAAKATERACFMLWYPIKSLTRPNAMIARVAAAGVEGCIAELVTTPLAHQRNRLNGSGVLLVRAPEAVRTPLAAIAPALGARLATRASTWSFRMQSWPAA